MKSCILRSLVFLSLVGFGSQVPAQAPVTLADFTNKVMTLFTTNGSASSVSALRIFTNGSLLISGYNLVGPTSAAYTNLSANSGLLVLSSTTVTNNLTLLALTTTNGLFTNLFRVTGVPQLQSNYGAYTFTAGTNVTPIIYSQTGNQILQLNGSQTLSVAAVGFTLSYQWRLNGVNLPGLAAQTNFYALINFLPANAGDYTCVVSNSSGVVTSAVINVSLAQPIMFTEQPQSQEIVEGSFLTLSFTATGSIVSTNWYRAGSYLSANNPLTIPIVTTADAGNYYAILGGYGETATSAVATVTVRKAGADTTWLGRPFIKVADDRGMAVPGVPGHYFINWINAALTPLITYRDGRLHFVAGTSAGVRSLFRWSNGVLSTLVFTNTPNPLGGFFGDIFYPTDEGDGVVNFTGNSASNAGMFAWSAGGISNVINFNTLAPGRTNFFGLPGSYGRRGAGVAISSSLFTAPGSYLNDGNGMYFHDGATIARICDNTTDLPGALTGYGFRPTGNSVNFDGANVVFSTTTGTGPGGFFKSTTNGVITKLADHTDLLPGSATQYFTNFSDLDVDGELIFGVANLQTYAFETNGAAMNIGFGTFVSAAGPRSVYFGSASSLSRWSDGSLQTVLVSGDIVDGKMVSQVLAADGQGNDVCVLLKFSDNSEGIYIASGVSSALPAIVTEPLDFNVIQNGNASFVVSATGAPVLRYQWFLGAMALAGGTNALLSLTNVQTADLGGYSVIVSNNIGSVTSRVAQLTRTIPALPTILSGPTISPTAVFGSNVTISVNFAGQAPLSFLWFKNGVLQPGATTNSISLTNIGAADRTNYFVILNNPAGSVTSSVVALNILPVITSQPVSVTNVVGSTVSFSVAANGIPPVTYQWRRGAGTPTTVISGATSTMLTLTNITSTNAMNYRVTVTSAGNGSVNSATVSLTVLSTNNPPMNPLLGMPLVVSNQFQFLLTTESGFSYQVQYVTNLSSTNWMIDQTVVGDGTTKTVTVNASPDGKFIRVLAQ